MNECGYTCLWCGDRIITDIDDAVALVRQFKLPDNTKRLCLPSGAIWHVRCLEAAKEQIARESMLVR